MDMTLGENLQKLRKEAGLSQEEVAARLYLSRQSVSKWENDNAEPGVDNLKALAKLYGVTVDELVGNVPEPEKRKTRFSPEQECYCAVAVLRTVWMLVIWVLTLFLIVLNGYQAEGGGVVFLTMFFLSLDWLVVLLGLWLRKPAVWCLAVFLELANVGVGMGLIELIYNSLFPGLVPVLTGSAMLVALFQRKIRTYLDIIVPDDVDL